MIGFFDALTELGADGDNLHRLDDSVPELLTYSTILTARDRDADLRLIEAVYEWQEAPLIFLIDGEKLDGNATQLSRIRRVLAMRGDAPYLGVVFPGRIDIYRIALDGKAIEKCLVKTGVSDDEKWLTFARLGNLRPAAKVNDKTWITGIILKLLDQAISSLKANDISGDDAISLVGRALFMRFLADRALLPPAQEIVPSIYNENEFVPEHFELFDRPDLVFQSCEWLDKTFNGELLPISDAVFPNLTAEACHVLGNVLRRAVDNQFRLGWKEQWDNLDFSHIPVGVLSQAYEFYLQKHAPKQQQDEGGFYTPHPIANLMVSAAFRALNAQGIAAVARVLDPASGAGVFLLAAFRELVAARWKLDGKRPDTAALREILYNQVRGFDINEAALRFCALGLYLLSIELDPNPKPVDKLHFDDLRGVVLFRPIEPSNPANPETKQLGSLGSLIGVEHNTQYDLVIGNPPWASATGLNDWNQVLLEVQAVAQERCGRDVLAPLPNAVLDLPFVWRAMRWAKPGAHIVFALHARFLFQQGDGMPHARQAIFEALDVTSIVNGSELRQTKVWPSISAPFCLLFAVNRPAHTASGFRMITPRYEKGFNNAGVMRLDATSAYVVRPQDLEERPETLKILFRGTEADLSLIDRVRRSDFTKIGYYWRDSAKTRLAHGAGYQSLRKSSKKNSDGTFGFDASQLHGLPHLDGVELKNLVIDPKSLGNFTTKRLHRVRNREIYTGPLLLIHKSPPANRQRIQMAVCDSDVVYNESWYGFSAYGSDRPELLTRYLALILGSSFALWISLITSGEFGFEREVIEKSVLEEIVFPPLEALDDLRQSEVLFLFSKLQNGHDIWSDVDAWVAKLYGLGDRDLTVINDTLKFNLPYAANRELAQSEPTKEQIELYCSTLAAELARFARRFEFDVHVVPAEIRRSSPWQALKLVAFSSGADDITSEVLNTDLRALTALADRTGAAEIVIDEGAGRLAMVILAQARYWSETQARLAAQRIIWSRPEFFGRRPSI